MKVITLLTFLTIYSFLGFSQSGANDSTLQIGSGFYHLVRSTNIQTDGKIIVGGDFTDFNGTAMNKIARINADGTLDASFNSGTGFNGSNPLSVRSINIQSDGKIIAGGGFASYNGTPRNNFVRLNTDGTLDALFNPEFINGHVYSTSIQSDGKIIVGGRFTYIGSTAINRIARLNADGTLDALFTPGTGFNGGNSITTVNAISIQPDGKIILGGDFTSFDGVTANRITRLNADGTLDTSFDSGTGFDGTVRSISIQSDGKIIVGGWFTDFNGTPKNNIVRLNTDGTLDSSFNSGTGFNGPVNTFSIQSDGKIIVGGDFVSFNGTTRNRIARLNADGTLDIFFNTPGSGFNAASQSISIQSDGKIIVGGSFTNLNGIPRNSIARLLNCTTPVSDISTLTDITEECEVTTLTAPTATSNCSGTLTATHNATLPITTQGTTVVTWTYDDGNGNILTQTQNVIVTGDVTAPVADITTLTDITAECVTVLTAPTATDNCAGTLTAIHDVTLPITTQGTTVVTWTYDDGNGNTSSQTQNVIVTGDTTAPVADIPTLTDITAECEITTLVAPTATDNCAGTLTATYNVTLPITTEGTTIITWTYDDGNGNTSTQTQNVIITAIDDSIQISGNGITLTANLTGAVYQWIDCDNGNAPISGATSRSFTPSENGNYAVEITLNGCTETSDCIAVNSVGIENQELTDFKLFPNPTTGKVTIEFGKIQEYVTIDIIDITGRIIETIIHNQPTNSIIIDLNGSPGFYNIQITTSKGRLLKKINLNH